MKVRAAMSEIIRVGGWALRGLGFPFGVAERGIPFVAWAEAAHGRALRCMRLTEERMSGSALSASPTRLREDSASWSLLARGKHLLESGPPAIDLLTADARLCGRARLEISAVFGMYLVPALCALAARRGLTCVAVYRCDEGDILPERFPREACLHVTPAATGPQFAIGPIDTQAVARLAGETAGAALPSLLHDTDKSRVAGDGHLKLFAFRDRIPPEHAMTGRLEPIDFAERVHRGYRDGVAMDEADLAYLYALERRTWAPTSERSRSQAGYGKF
jgi:hypothetical protein